MKRGYLRLLDCRLLRWQNVAENVSHSWLPEEVQLRQLRSSFDFQSLSGWRLLVAVLTLIAAFLLQSQAFIRASSTTWDEGDHLLSGVRYLTCRDFGINFEHPPLAKELAAMPLVLFDRNLRETGECGQRVTSTSEAFTQGRKFLYGNDADKLHLWSRSAESLIGVALLILVFAAAREIFGAPAGLVALFLAAFEPNLIVNSSLVTTDAAVAFGFFAASYAAYRYTMAPTLLRAVITGTALGITLSAKHSGVLIIPTVLLMILIDTVGRAREGVAWRPLALRLTRDTCVVFAVALTILWAAYGFRFAALPGIPDSSAAFQGLVDNIYTGNKPPLLTAFLKWAVNWRIVPESYGWGFIYVLTDVIGGRAVWILGHLYPTGKWFYFPLAIAVKAPLSLLLLAAIGIFLRLPSARMRKVSAFLVVPPALWLATSMTSKMNIGVRHVLPVFPFLILIAAGSAILLARRGRAATVVVLLLLAFQVFSVVHSAPNLLAYSNEVWGGTRQTYRVLSGPNTDWGQGLKAARSWVDARGLKDCWYVNYGTGNPAYFGIPCRVLPSGYNLSFPPSEVPALIPPHVSGTLLVSVGALRTPVGLELMPYRQFWTAAPADVIGGSILVFQGEFSLQGLAAANRWARAQQFLVLGDIKAAANEVQTSLMLQPRDPRAYIVLARIEARRGDIAASRAAYARALALTYEVDPDFMKSTRAIVERELKELESAHAETKPGIPGTPPNHPAE